MKFLRRLLARAANFAFGRQSDPRLREEMEQHLALQTEENLRAGMTEPEARRQAVLKFGAVEAVRENYHAEQGLPFLENLWQDLRFAIRMLVRSPGFAAVAILTTALGIGATTAIFSVVDATLLRPLSYPHPEELVSVEDNLQGVGAQRVGMSIPEWRDLARSGIFQYVGLIGGGSVNLTGSAQPARIQFEAVTPNYLSLLGVKPELGRVFNPGDQTPGFNLEVVISDGLWKRAFGADPHILGRSLRLDNDQYQIVGVMPPGFRDPGRTAQKRNTELWAASGFAAAPAPPPNRSSRLLLDMVGRLTPGLTVEAAQSRLDALVANLKKQYPADYPPQSGWTVRLAPLKESLVGSVRLSLILLLCAVGLVLLIACMNVANLLLARASARGREIAVRQALGATRGRVIRQLFTESLLLSVLGGAVGLVVLFCTRGLLVQMVPESLPRLSDISIDWRVLLCALAASGLAGAIFGLAPALHTGRLDLNHTLRQEGRGSRGSAGQSQTRRALVVIEFALSLVLMIVAGLLLRSFWDLLKVQLGFNPQHVMAVQTWLPVPNDPATDVYGTPAQEAPLLRELLRRGRALPGVEQAAMGSSAALPLNHDRNLFPLIVEGRDVRVDQPPLIEMASVTSRYFHLMEIPLDRGRLFDDTDSETAPGVALVNETLARTYWRNQDPIGKRFRTSRTRPATYTVVGIVADARTESLAQPAVPEFYLSAFQTVPRDLTIFLRGKLDVAAIPSEVREQVQSVNRELPVFGAQTLDDVLQDSLSERRFSVEMVALFALTALLLAGLGIYGTISYVVSERTREIGIRIALGAQRGKILTMVLLEGLGLAMSGAALGLGGAFLTSHLMAGLLFGVRPTDPLTFVGVTVLLTVVALLACYVPATRAMRVDPQVALRYE